ncbi:protein-tyrosine phosphatase [Microbacterium ginsengiterrae]|uniref:Protein-tyrosine phosphatase n=1 Tax=Microbacterium ginsengiterrae TaxID=546115 RepID=A0A7W9FC15_9MICO|nr:tyrosine-protein phosphatase [Microbacterium ginsengiterrae]MBB5742003.1 protein-tyrosine phosphatase [Microbacterium ginsengiterrae]
MDDAVTRLDIPGTYNFREAARGALTPGMLYRSDALHRLSPAGRRRIAELGIGTVIDLRSPFDRRVGGRDRLRGTGAVRTSIPIDGASRRVDLKTITLGEVYRLILDEHQHALGRIIRAIADADDPVLVHCTAGKDRTGLAIALVLEALEVDRRIILADYAASAPNLAGEWTHRMVGTARRFRVHLTDDLLVILGSSPPEVLDAALCRLDRLPGGIDAYLDGAGVDAAVRGRLRAKLLA